MKNQRLYVDVHVLQTVPPSCLNRDDTGSPKMAIYGGVSRARVSSQSWKKAVRDEFNHCLIDNNRGYRTLHAAQLIEKKIVELSPEFPSALKVAEKILNSAGVTTKENTDPVITKALFFISDAQAEALAKFAVTNPEIDGKKVDKEIQNALQCEPSIDIALFGRMVADDPRLNTDACAQVAHAISTHTISNDYDYFTAVDDLSPEDTAGAGHLGTVEFNSSTMYRYCTVAVHRLHELLGDITGNALRAFLEAFIVSMPTGKQNTFANRTLPDVLLVTIRNDQPINLVGAFEKPITSSEKGYVEPSKRAFVEYAKRVYADFAGEPLKTYSVGSGFEELGERVTIKEMLDNVESMLTKLL